jgi:hypothetical protein
MAAAQAQTKAEWELGIPPLERIWRQSSFPWEISVMTNLSTWAIAQARMDRFKIRFPVRKSTTLLI